MGTRQSGARTGFVAGALAVTMLAAIGGQSVTRRATNLAAILTYPSFYHLRPVVVVGQVQTQPNGDVEIASGAAAVRVVTSGNVANGTSEVRGEFWDVGRMKPDDPRLATYDLQATFRIQPERGWPRPGEVLVIVAGSVGAASTPVAPSIRAIVLNPARYRDERVTVTGRFSGRNLTGDLPDAPGRSRYDFVLRGGDAALWVSNVPPRGKTFELSLDARSDTGRWLQVTGTVRQARGLQWIEADAGSLALAAPVPDAESGEGHEPAPRALTVPVAEPTFSTPTHEETDVALAASVRIQFSRDLDTSTLKGRIRVAYRPTRAEAAGGQTPLVSEFVTRYDVVKRVLELKFARPFEPFRTVDVELLEGIRGGDGQPVKPWRLTFEVGGQ